MHVRRLVALLLACAAVLALSGATAMASSSKVLYSSTDPGVGNIPSVGVEAYGFSQIGDEVILKRVAKINSVAVQLSDWACQSGAWFSGDCLTTPGATFTTPITLNIYKASTTDGAGETTPGGLLLTKTKTFTIPFRPSASTHCTGPEAGEWFKNGQGCFNGLAHTITFTLSGLKTKLPRDVVWGVSYSSDHFGPNPIGSTNSPEDSLNVGLAPRVRVGRHRFPGGIFWDTQFAGNSCGAPFVPGDFNLDNAGACWAGFVPAAQFNAS
ncbi:MAG TPA: hypothetical protein VGI72_13670 [Gaiellales bacterium]|jgi:hypothetical protein